MTELTLETYARVLAHVACRRGARVPEILADLGVEAEALRAAEAAFREQLAGAWEGRKGIVAMKFAAALGAELARLGPVGGDGAPPEALAGEPALPVPPADARPREPEVPSYLQAAPSQVPIGPVVPSTPALNAVAPPAFVKANVLPEPAPAPSIGGTANMDLSAIVAAVRQGALPFKPADPSSAAVAAPREEPRPVPDRPATARLGGTVNADLSAITAAVERGPLPFHRAETPSPAGDADPGDDVDFALLPLETYASVSGALARGASRAEALAKHGLRADVFDRLAKAWSLRFQREPHLLARFKELARNSAAGWPGE